MTTDTTQMTATDLRDLARRVRTERGLTQAQAGESVGVSMRHYRKCEAEPERWPDPLIAFLQSQGYSVTTTITYKVTR